MRSRADPESPGPDYTSRVGAPDFWLDRRVLVTGASGLLGAWLVEDLLGRGAHVVALRRDRVGGSRLNRPDILSRIDVVAGRVEDLPLLDRTLGEYEIETVFHLAAQTIVPIANRNPLSTYETNIRGTYLLLEACRRSPRVQQIVLASSDKAYGDQAVLPYDETTPLQGSHPYDVSKSCADLIGHAYARTYGMGVAITRCGNFFGGGDLNWNRIVPGTIRDVLRGRRPVIRSDGSLVRDYIYVRDAAAAYLLLAERLGADPSLKGEAFNFSNETRWTVLDLVKAILKAMERADLEPDVRNEATNEIRVQVLSAGKARERLGWKPRWTIEQALRETIAWYREHLGAAARAPRPGPQVRPSVSPPVPVRKRSPSR